jgi:serine/threonine protein phosphatase PrpC
MNNGRVGVAISQGRRPYHEDRHVVIPDLFNEFSLYGVFDGHGGHDVSDACAAHLPHLIRSGLERLSQQGNGTVDPMAIREMLFHTFIVLHEQLLQPKSSYLCGSTCLVVLRRRNQVWVANTGDSRAILGLGRLSGRVHDVVNLTRDHKPGSATEKHRIETAGGYVQDVHGVPRVIGELAVSRAIGDKRYHPYVIPHPDVMYYPLTPGTMHSFIVLATDGLWDVMSSDEVGNFIVLAARAQMSGDAAASPSPPSSGQVDAQSIAASLMARAYERHNAEDNMTIILTVL